MKFYSWNTKSQHTRDLLMELKKKSMPPLLRRYIIKILDGKIITNMEGLVSKMNREHSAVGVLDLHDLTQEHYYALIKAYNNVDWDIINNSSNPDGRLWAYLHKSIKFDVRIAVNAQKDGIRVPQYKIWKEKLGKYEFGIDNFKTQNFAPTYMEETVLNPEPKPWDIEELNSELDTFMRKHLDRTEQAIIEMSYGINELNDKKRTGKYIAEFFGVSRRRINEIKKNAMDKLKVLPVDELKRLKAFL